ncbi:MAG: GntR family transcriptional regulator [Pikeienuella sp.]
MNSALFTPQLQSPDQRIARRPLAQELAERLRTQIVDGTLAPGTKLSEQALCDRFGVSRTPLREALNMLAAEGLVLQRPGRGAVVSPLTLTELEETFPVIGALEALAGELAAARATAAEIDQSAQLQERLADQHRSGDLAGYAQTNAEIHALLRQAAGNATLALSIAGLDVKLRRARRLANLAPQRWAEAVEEHAQIHAALAARDGARLSGLLRRHLANKAAALLRQFES